MKAVVFSKENCPFCDDAKQLLTNLEIEMKIIQVGVDISKPDFLEKLSGIAGKEVTTVPQIILDGDYVGGYTELKALGLINQNINVDDFNFEL